MPEEAKATTWPALLKRHWKKAAAVILLAVAIGVGVIEPEAALSLLGVM